MSKPTPMNNHAHEFKKIIEGFHYSRGIREIFIDWLELAACAVHQEPYHLGLVQKDEAFNKIEEQYLAVAKKYNREELDTFGKLLGITKMALWEEKTDFLGQLYMDLEISQERSGEFFTPFSLSLMIAKMTLDNSGEHIKEKGFITVSEPACGGGGMLIAAAKVLEEAGYNPSEVMFFDATDISKPCCDMAYLQTSILGLSGIVRHGDTLRMNEWSNRFTPVCRVYPARTNTFIDSLKPSKTDETPPAPSDLKQNQEQQTLALNLAAETSGIKASEKTKEQEKAPKTAAKPDVIDKLSQETDTSSYVQGSLF